MASKRKSGIKHVLELLENDSNDSDFEKELSDSESEVDLRFITSSQSRSGQALMKTVNVMLEIVEKRSSLQSQDLIRRKPLFVPICGMTLKTSGIQMNWNGLVAICEVFQTFQVLWHCHVKCALMTVPQGATDRLAAIRDIFDRVVAAFRWMYNLTEYLTLNEALEGFRGRCGFVQYMPMKPTNKAAVFM